MKTKQVIIVLLKLEVVMNDIYLNSELSDNLTRNDPED